MAFGSFGGGSDTPLAEINVTPLVDVMLVLLIVFMITMPVMTHSLSVQLPENKAVETAQPEQPVRLVIDASGQYSLNQQAVGADGLAAALAAGFQDKTLAIEADKHVSYDYVARAIAAAKQAGIRQVGLVNTNRAQ